MLFRRVARILFLLALPLAVFSSGSAASLEGKVMDVADGEDVAVLSQGHLVKVKLIAVAAPDKKQSFADIARQHLADLILNKFVVVRYSSLREGYIVGQVLLEKMDVGAQMLRDGVGWYNKLDETNLSEIDRQVYQGSERAARSERRGLWQEQSPVSPWDYRNAQVVQPRPSTKHAEIPTYNTSLEHLPRQVSSARRGNGGGLSSEDLMGGILGPGAIAGKPDIKPLSSAGAAGHWLRFQPEDKHFSILVPSDGVEITYPVLDGRGKTTDFHYVGGPSDKTVYFAMWAKGPNGNSTDDSAADEAVKGMLAGFNRSSGQSGLAANATPGRSLKFSGYTGREFAIELGPVSGVLRVFSKQSGAEREILMLCVMSAIDSEPSGDAFFNSLKIR